MGMPHGPATLENGSAVYYNVKYTLTVQPRNPYRYAWSIGQEWGEKGRNTSLSTKHIASLCMATKNWNLSRHSSAGGWLNQWQWQHAESGTTTEQSKEQTVDACNSSDVRCIMTSERRQTQRVTSWIVPFQ